MVELHECYSPFFFLFFLLDSCHTANWINSAKATELKKREEGKETELLLECVQDGMNLSEILLKFFEIHNLKTSTKHS